MRVKSAMDKFLKNIIKLQTTWREFSARRKMHLLVLEQRWLGIEDEFLSSYFSLCYRKLFAGVPGLCSKEALMKSSSSQQMREAVQRSQSQHVKVELQHQQKGGDDLRAFQKSDTFSCNWQRFRIPHRDRHEVLGQYYRMRLNEHIQYQDNILKIKKSASGWQKDLDTFLRRLKSAGGDEQSAEGEAAEAAAQKSPAEEQSKCFWDCPQNTCLALIALVAKSLAQVDPFQDHPANNDVLEQMIGGQAEPKTKARGGSGGGKKINCLALPTGMDYALRGDKKKKKQESRGSLQQRCSVDDINFDEGASDPAVAPGANLEGIFDSFTPRLLEYAEEEREGSEPDLSQTPETLMGACLQRPSVLKAAVASQGQGAHPD